MTRRTLAASVSAEVYDQFRALLPDGVDVNMQLCALVEAFIAGAPSEVDLAALKARWLEEWAADLAKIPAPEQPDTAPMAIYDPDRPLAEQIAALEPGSFFQMPDHPVELRDVLGEAQTAIHHSRSDAAMRELTGDTLVAVDADVAVCLHPHASLVREGRFVRCTLCDRIIR